jgi:hypothetical protein
VSEKQHYHSGRIDMAGARQRKRKRVDDLIAVHPDCHKESGAELILGEGIEVLLETELITVECQSRRQNDTCPAVCPGV